MCLAVDCAHLSLHSVEDEPAFLPGLDSPAHLVQPAATRVSGHDHVRAHVQLVAGALDVRAQVKVLGRVGQEASHGPSLLCTCGHTGSTLVYHCLVRFS